MPDRVFYPLSALIIVMLIGLASAYPQGQGARSPKPFGHATWAQTHPPKPPAAKPGAVVKPPSDAANLKGPF
jgi:hypothetical protein